MEKPLPSRDITDLIALMAALRTPGTGCEWDLAQDFASIAPYTLEEAHEVVDAIARGDLRDLREELGDLLLQVVFHARMAEEAGAFAFGDVVEAITAKLIRRHPHVFGASRHLDRDAVKALWAQIKAEERRAQAEDGADGMPVRESLLDGVRAGMPPFARAVALQEKAATVGFDWPDLLAVLAKAREELAELEEAVSSGTPDAIGEELGDLLFVLANVARHAGLSPELAMAAANNKFICRFRLMEEEAEVSGRALSELSLAEQEALWQRAKRAPRPGPLGSSTP